jgi:hypothetical protein
MSKVMAAVALGWSVFGAGAVRQQSRGPEAVTLHVVSFTDEMTAFEIDHADITLVLTEHDVRLVVRGDAHVRLGNGSGAEVFEMSNPTLILSRPVLRVNADQINIQTSPR